MSARSSMSWDRLVSAFAHRAGARGARRLARRLLVLALLRAHFGSRSPLLMDTVRIGEFLDSLPLDLRASGQDTVVEFMEFLVEQRRASGSRRSS